MSFANLKKQSKLANLKKAIKTLYTKTCERSRKNE